MTHRVSVPTYCRCFKCKKSLPPKSKKTPKKKNGGKERGCGRLVSVAGVFLLRVDR